MTRDQRNGIKRKDKATNLYRNRRKGKSSKKDKAKNKHERQKMW